MRKIKADLDLIKQTVSVYTEDMQEYLDTFLKRLGCTVHVDDIGNVIAFKGDKQNAPILIAHTDTVFNHPPVNVHLLGDWLVGMDEDISQCGCGFDDRAGVSAILQMIPHLRNVIAVFPAYEESGCYGSSEIDVDMINDGYIAIQIDRRIKSITDSDAIWHTNGVSIASMEFKEYVKETLEYHGFHLNQGVYTDIGELKINGLLASGLNLSAGYMREHTDSEVLHVPSYERSIACCMDLIELCKNKRFKHRSKIEIVKGKIKKGGYRADNGYSWWGYEDLDYAKDPKTGTYKPTDVVCDTSKAKRYSGGYKLKGKQIKGVKTDDSWMYVSKGEDETELYYKGHLKPDDEIAMYDKCDMCGKSTELYYRGDGGYVCWECIKAYKL